MTGCIFCASIRSSVQHNQRCKSDDFLACESLKKDITMKTKTSSEKQDLTGSTDHVEQLAADLAEKKNQSKVTDKDRQQALEQMQETSPRVHPDKTTQK